VPSPTTSRENLNTGKSACTPRPKPPVDWRRLPVRTLVLSPVLPPGDSGHAVVLDRFFRSVLPDDYRLATFGIVGVNPNPAAAGPTPLPAVTFDYGHLNQWRSFGPGQSATRMLRRFAAAVMHRAGILTGIARQEQCQAIIVTTGEFPDIPAAILTGQRLRIPVLLWYMDHWRFQQVIPVFRRLAARLEPIVTRAAAGIIVPNELLGNELARAYGIIPELIRNPTDASNYRYPRAEAWPARSDRVRVVYTGVISPAQYDAVQRLLDALTLPEMHDVELHIYSGQSVSDLQAQGLTGSFHVHPFVRPPEIYQIQQKADILFLALGFNTPYTAIIRTSATTKLADYLASGTPLLVHSPAGSFPAWYARTHGCGLVVDQPEPAMLAAAIRTLRSDGVLRDRLGANSRRLAASEFSIETATCRLIDLLTQVTR
jgi:glycosyltransferase involved in cell wall biosynthesis